MNTKKDCKCQCQTDDPKKMYEGVEPAHNIVFEIKRDKEWNVVYVGEKGGKLSSPIIKEWVLYICGGRDEAIFRILEEIQSDERNDICFNIDVDGLNVDEPGTQYLDVTNGPKKDQWFVREEIIKTKDASDEKSKKTDFSSKEDALAYVKDKAILSRFKKNISINFYPLES